MYTCVKKYIYVYKCTKLSCVLCGFNPVTQVFWFKTYSVKSLGYILDRYKMAVHLKLQVEMKNFSKNQM